MIAHMPPPKHRFYVEYIDDTSKWEGTKHRSIHIYSTSELSVKETLKDYMVLFVDQVD